MVRKRSRKYSARSRRASTRRRRTTGTKTSRKRRTTRSRSRRSRSRRSRSRSKCLSSRPISWKPQKSSNLPLCGQKLSNPCENPCNNRSEWVKLALKNNYFLTWAKLLAHLGRCDPGSTICQPFGGITPPEGSLLEFQKQFKPRVSIVMGLGNTAGDYTLAHVELSFNNAVLAPPATGTVKGKCIAGASRGKALKDISTTGVITFENGDAEAKPVSVVVGGVQKGFGAGMFNQFVEINGEAVLLAEEFCRMPAWPAAKDDVQKKQDSLMIPYGPGCCLPGIPGINVGVGTNIPIMRTPIPPGSVLDDILLADCRVPILKTGIGATLPSQVRRSLSWQKTPLSPASSKEFFIKRNASLAVDNKETFSKFKVIFNQEKTCGQNLLEQLLVNTIGDGTSFGFYGKDDDTDASETAGILESAAVVE